MWATHPKLSINVNALLVIQQNLERKSQFEKKLLLISIISHLPLRCIARWLHYHYHYMFIIIIQKYYYHYQSCYYNNSKNWIWGPKTAKFGPKLAFWAKYRHFWPTWSNAWPKNNADKLPKWFSVMLVPKLLLNPIKIRLFGPKTAKFGPKYAFLVILAMQAYSMPCWWVIWWLWRAGCISQDTYLLYVGWLRSPNVGDGTSDKTPFPQPGATTTSLHVSAPSRLILTNSKCNNLNWLPTLSQFVLWLREGLSHSFESCQICQNVS